MPSSIAYVRDTDRYDWVWVLRATTGQATARDLSTRELDEAVTQLREAGLTDNSIAERLHTSIRLVRNRASRCTTNRHGRHAAA